MKRIMVLSLICGSFFSSAYCQLQVESNGNVGVRYSGNSSIYSYFTVASPGDTNTCAYITSEDEDHDVALRLIKKGTVTSNHNYTRGLYSTVRYSASSSRMAYGIYSRAYKENEVDTNTGRSYGVYSYAGNSTPGWNYALFGTLYGNNEGAGVFGSSESFDAGMQLDDKYAGFFHGKVKATNAMYATAFNVSSDYRLKENIVSIESERIDDIMKLNVVKYNLKQRTMEADDTTTVPVKYYTEDPDLLDKTHYGLIAQELQDIYPNLVYEGGDGYLSINYIELIPLLIQSIQSLRNEIDELKGYKEKQIMVSSQKEKDTSLISRISVSDKSISITCMIPESVINARMTICDTNGNQLYVITISERGLLDFTIKDLPLNEAIYVCSLMTDEMTDSRRFYYGK